MIGKKVRIQTEDIETDVEIVDKIMTNMARYSKQAVTNNAPFEVYVGYICDFDVLELECPLIQFLPEHVIQIY